MSECHAAVIIAGEHFSCDWPTDENGRHDGWAHANSLAETIWLSGDEPWVGKYLDGDIEWKRGTADDRG